MVKVFHSNIDHWDEMVDDERWPLQFSLASEELATKIQHYYLLDFRSNEINISPSIISLSPHMWVTFNLFSFSGCVMRKKFKSTISHMLQQYIPRRWLTILTHLFIYHILRHFIIKFWNERERDGSRSKNKWIIFLTVLKHIAFGSNSPTSLASPTHSSNRAMGSEPKSSLTKLWVEYSTLNLDNEVFEEEEDFDIWFRMRIAPIQTIPPENKRLGNNDVAMEIMELNEMCTRY